MADTRTTTLSEFLLARIAEDEAHAHEAIDVRHFASWTYDAMGIYTVGGHDLDPIVEYVNHHEACSHIARHDPARVLTECYAKRRLVEAMADWGQEKWLGRVLVMPYADHPDCLDEWVRYPLPLRAGDEWKP